MSKSLSIEAIRRATQLHEISTLAHRLFPGDPDDGPAPEVFSLLVQVAMTYANLTSEVGDADDDDLAMTLFALCENLTTTKTTFGVTTRPTEPSIAALMTVTPEDLEKALAPAGDLAHLNGQGLQFELERAITDLKLDRARYIIDEMERRKNTQH